MDDILQSTINRFRAYLGYVRDTCKKVSQGCESYLGSDTFDDHTHHRTADAPR